LTKNDICKYYKLLNHSNETEIRVFKPAKSIHINSEQNFLKAVIEQNKSQNVYAGLNERCKDGTKKVDVLFFNALLCDIDIVKGASKAQGREVADKVFAFLKSKGAVASLADSGSGYHILIPTTIKAGTETQRTAIEEKMKALGKMLAGKFDSEFAFVDQAVFELARLSKVIGTHDFKSGNETKFIEYNGWSNNIAFFKWVESLPGKKKKKTKNKAVKPSHCAFIEYACNHKLPEGERNQSVCPNIMALVPDRASEFAEVQEMLLSDVVGWDDAEFNCKQLQNFNTKHKLGICENCKMSKPVEQTKNVGEAELEVLKDENLFSMITKDELDKKIVKENEAREVIFLVGFCGSLVKNARPTSSNLLVNGESGIGKDYTTENTLKILPKEKMIKRTRISPTVFTYWHNAKYEPEWSWEGKTVYLEDISSSILNSEVFKVMASGGSKATIVVNQQAVDIEINGKPSLIITAASSTPKAELVRRFPIVQLDESVDQTKAINIIQAKQAATGTNSEYSDVIKQALNCLKRVEVKVPFANDLVGMLPTTHIIMRTHFNRFLDYIKFSTALHQFQRQTDEDGFFLAEEQDFKIARKVLLKTTSNSLMIPITKDQQKLIKVVSELGTEVWHRVSDIEPSITNMSERWLRTQLDYLTGLGFLEKSKEDVENRKPVMVYRACKFSDLNIPETIADCKNKNKKSCRNSSSASSSSVSSITSISSDGEYKPDTAQKQQILQKQAVEASTGALEQLEQLERGAAGIISTKNVPSAEPTVPKVDRKVIL